MILIIVIITTTTIMMMMMMISIIIIIRILYKNNQMRITNITINTSKNLFIITMESKTKTTTVSRKKSKYKLIVPIKCLAK